MTSAPYLKRDEHAFALSEDFGQIDVAWEEARDGCRLRHRLSWKESKVGSAAPLPWTLENWQQKIFSSLRISAGATTYSLKRASHSQIGSAQCPTRPREQLATVARTVSSILTGSVYALPRPSLGVVDLAVLPPLHPTESEASACNRTATSSLLLVPVRVWQ